MMNRSGGPGRSWRPSAFSRRLRTGMLALLLAAVAIGCGGSKDDRDEVRARYGEPDDTILNEGPVTDTEVWYYSDFDSSGVAWCFQFQRNRNSCGSSDNFYKLLDGGEGFCRLYFDLP